MARSSYSDAIEEIRKSVEFDQETAKLEFALELKRVMERESISNAELAERLGVSRPMVSKLLRGDANMTIETMVKACRSVGSKLFVKIVRRDCHARLFELVQTEKSRAIESRAGEKSWAVAAGQDAWSMAANDFGNLDEGYEEKPLAA